MRQRTPFPFNSSFTLSIEVEAIQAQVTAIYTGRTIINKARLKATPLPLNATSSLLKSVVKYIVL